MNNLKIIGIGCIVVIGLAAMLGSQSTPRSSPEPVFTSFSLVPQVVCLNQGIPLVQVNYEFDPDGWNNENTLCTTIYANGDTVHPTLRHQCLSDGTTGSYTFNLQDHFGTNIPQQVTVRVELTPSVAGETYDFREGVVDTRVDCPPAGGVPIP
ncbi:hypothetical protein [Rheinheimera salexigens]|uniref:Uncharacterized protein n=1 Tax=Rheinheimera salexigens TaxID=1628148 RepID=A0A1E7Q5N8_9GAMM|nr:hypothetical protein [Rheinheimera salexigens]OEY69378.1 hypothetical protein BI198_07195 [Rheinheimera salexigens]